MKQTCIFIFSTLCFLYSEAQSDGAYDALKRAGDSLYKNKEYKSAATAFSLASDVKPSVDIYHRAAFAWSLGGEPDSAFSYLNKIVSLNSLTPEQYVEIIEDRDFKPIRADSRWQHIKSKMFQQARETFSSSLSANNAKLSFQERVQMAEAWSLTNDDSTLGYLNTMAELKNLSYAEAGELISNKYFSNLKNRSGWELFIDKLYSTTFKRYFPTDHLKRPSKKLHIVIDEAHNNYHTISGTYFILSRVLSASGYKVSGQKAQFTESNLNDANILVISNPLPEPGQTLAAKAKAANEPMRWSAASVKSAFTEDEVSALIDWIKRGGSLFLILDHAPYPAAGQLITKALGVDHPNVATYDKAHRDLLVDSTKGNTILFTRSKSLIGKHKIMNGVDSVTTATGSSLVGPANSSTLLQLSPTAIDQDWLPDTKKFRERTAAGRTQGVAFEFGRGRVVVLGEAALLRPGMVSKQNRGNWRMAVNIINWLARQDK
jgi:tetratricopeptide (TPR) repeat protein